MAVGLFLISWKLKIKLTTSAELEGGHGRPTVIPHLRTVPGPNARHACVWD